ncbi:MAG: phosphoribosylformylglycinamidine synthase subunit PurQ, partial [Candidatus Omnitrophica bacterium]|nr:phosphoribosylformylglycinamidine synthase subunit PurQ [Candidatus Omnitrophota bacterium]
MFFRNPAVAVLILKAPGTNCDGETKAAFDAAGARADII